MVDFIHFLDHIYLLSIGAHLLTHFVRSLIRLALPSLRCGRFAAHLLTHFVRSLLRLALPSVTQLPSVAELPSVILCAHLLTSFARSLFALAIARAPLGRYKQVLTLFALVYSLVSSISIAPCDFVFCFALYNLSGGGCPSDTLINVHSLCQIRLSNRYVHTAGRSALFGSLRLCIACIVCTISFERPVNYLCDAWHVFPPKYEAWTHFNN